MTQSVRTRTLRGPQEPLDDLDGGGLSVSLASADIFERLWHFFISMRTGLALILILAALSLVGTVLVQAPAGLRSDAAAYAAWLEDLRPKYGGWTDVLDRLGFFSIFGSVWFRGIVVLLSTSILACSVNRAPRLWKQAVHPRLRMSPSFYVHAAMHGTIEATQAPDGAAEAVRSQLRARHYRTIVEADPSGAVDIYADRFRWGPFGTVIAHLSIILILIGALLGAAGFRNAEFAVPVGTSVPVGNGTTLSVEALSFNDSYYEDGSPSDYASHLVVWDGTRKVADQTIRVNQPLRYGDVSFYQSFFGPAADVEVRDVTGAIVHSAGVPLLWRSTDENKAIGSFEIPERGLTVYVIGVASGKVDAQIRAGQMQFEVYQDTGSNVPVGIEVATQGQPTTIAGLDFTFLRERQFTGLIVARDPGVPFIWAGAIFLILGVMLVFFFPNRRIWARVRPDAAGSVVEIGALTRHDVIFEATFGTLVDDVATALEEGAAA